MPSPKKSPGRKALDGAKPSFDIEAQAASPSPSGRHTTNMTYDGYVDHQQPSSNPLGEDKTAVAGGMPVAFKDLTYRVQNNNNRREKCTLLHKVSGYFVPGELSALMGPSGSSKTTLLDVLAGRKTVGTISGKVAFGGQGASRGFLRRYTGYVEQNDTLIGNLTVMEMLLYTAELKLPMSMTWQQKVVKVMAIIQQLALTTCMNVRIGSAVQRGISGGQCKRTNIGIALVSDPKVLFMDEPTSGLDSFTANEVMTVVKKLTQMNLTVCATIHSPTPYCFNQFDRLMLLLRGQTVYFGPNGSAPISYLEALFPETPKFSAHKSDLHNRAEFIVDITTKADRQGRHGSLAEKYAGSELKRGNMRELEKHLTCKVELPPSVLKDFNSTSETSNHWWWITWVLLQYRMGRDIMDHHFLGPRIMDKLVLSLIVMSLYYQVGANQAPSNVNNLTAVLFLWTILPGYAAASYMPTIVLERPLFVRERNDGLYRPSTYLLFKMVEEMTVFFFLSLVTTSIVFAPCRLGGSFLLFWLVNFITTATGIAIGYFIAAISPNMDMANAALPAYVTVLLFFVGLLLRNQDQPVYWRWFSNLDFLRFAWSAQMINQFEGSKAMALDFQSVLKFYNLEGQSKWLNLLYETCFLFLFLVLAWAGLAFKRHISR
ncbi:hypothetical protein CVIRNUC_002316 [Coccomyxa viridis]|uniref:ABC transporter domain-containing protein n=1 Tax=Coccomyxa viridis TaxID=1274662 RepID=A0AAV1HVC2_9CHLO|nr:hypothetical protein CVIRNUC_002316 [Coccomyxa viridis]